MKRDQPKPARSNLAFSDEIEVVIEKLVAGGDGLARHEGMPVFVARTAPGDRVRVRVTQRKPSYARAEIVELLCAGAGRREPRCRHFGECGGCDLQHLEDDLQVEYKVAATVETLTRLGRVELPAPRVVSGSSWGYRTRTQLHTTLPRDRAPGERPVVGYHARQSHRLVAVEECPVLVPELESIVRRLSAAPSSELPPRIDLAVGGNGDLTSAPVIEDLPHGEVETRVGEYTYRFDARCFFQGHRELLPRLVEDVVGTGTGELAVDLYAGVGLFALPLARRYERVVAVEGHRIAVRYGRINVRRNRLANVEVVHQAVESWISSLPRDCDRVVVDPPRAGLGSSVLARLKAASPACLTYASCHPAALARDLAALDEAYKVGGLTMIDLFPQTGHIEVVAELTLR